MACDVKRCVGEVLRDAKKAVMAVEGCEANKGT